MKNIFGITDTGLVRSNNQDAYTIEKSADDIAFVILCDGMGGENGGNIASAMAVEHASAVLKRDLVGELSELSLRAIMMSAVAGANALIYDAAQRDESLTGMGTTIILAVFLRSTLYIVCVGDSRAYLVSSEQELQITRDHTVVQMLVDIGEITLEDAKTHPKRHFITRAVGVGPSVEADFIVQDLNDGDRVLLCSDGLYSYLEPQTLWKLLDNCIQSQSAEPLIDLAKAGGGADNITAIVCCD